MLSWLDFKKEKIRNFFIQLRLKHRHQLVLKAALLGLPLLLLFQNCIVVGTQSSSLTSEASSSEVAPPTPENPSDIGSETPPLAEEAPLQPSGPRELKIQGLAANGDDKLESTCAIQKGVLKCWGANQWGQLGDGTTTTRLIPTEVLLEPVDGQPGKATAVAIGRGHTCAIVSESLQCWGNNSYGQLGLGTTKTVSLKPTTVIQADVLAVATGAQHTCAIVRSNENQQLHCWGGNFAGQLGDGTVVDSADPKLILEGDITRIVAGAAFNCAIVSGDVHCWGNNEWGQVGNGSVIAVHRPVLVLKGDVREMAAGGAHICAIVGSSLACWGLNESGQIGDGTKINQLKPKTVIESGVVGIGTGRYHTCAIVDASKEGELWCWGDNRGPLDPLFKEKVITNHRKLVDSGATMAAGGFLHNCAVINDELFCWGGNSFGQLGIGKLLHPNRIIGGDWIDLSGGRMHTCALKKDRSLWCWGDNLYGQLGDGTVINRNLPTNVKNLNGPVQSFELGLYHSCAIVGDRGQLQCWGRNDKGQVGNGNLDALSTPETIIESDVVQVSVGDGGTCAVKKDGTLWCWGLNHKGQLGVGDKVDRSKPVQVVALGSQVKFVSTNGYVFGGSYEESHTCALKTDGSLWCWGANESGQLGDGTTGNKSVPTEVKIPGTQILSVSVGSYHTCATTKGIQPNSQQCSQASGVTSCRSLGESDQLYCWGWGFSGELGFGFFRSHMPNPMASEWVSGLGPVTEIFSGNQSTCGVVNSRPFCWGRNTNGKLGLGHPSNEQVYPAALNLENVKKLAVDTFHGCALKHDGSIWCWGANDSGQLGLGYEKFANIDLDFFEPPRAPVINFQSRPIVSSEAPTAFTLWAQAMGNPLPSMQWYRNGELIPGATGSNYVVQSSKVEDSGSYFVRATNSKGTADSHIFTVNIRSFTIAEKPVITKQPGPPITKTAPAYFNLFVEAVGQPALTYQWYLNDKPISGGNTSTLFIPAAYESDSGLYFVRVSNSAGFFVDSEKIEVKINAPIPPKVLIPQISAQPRPATIIMKSGGTASFSLSVTATSDPAPTYQWYKTLVGQPAKAIPGATSSTYTKTSASESDAGDYFVRVTNGHYFTDSYSVSVSVEYETLEPIFAAASPNIQYIDVNKDLHFFLNLTGGFPALQYQWHKNGSPIPGATASSLSFAQPTDSDAGEYRVKVTWGSRENNYSFFAVPKLSPPLITTQPWPLSRDIAAGSLLEIYAYAIHPDPVQVRVQWYKDNAPIPGATNFVFSKADVSIADTGSYFARATSVTGQWIDSKVVSVTVRSP